MHRSLLVLGSALLLGCGATHLRSPARAVGDGSDPHSAAIAGTLQTADRKPGDVVVHRFPSSEGGAPLVVTERVLDRRGGFLTLQVTTDEGGARRDVRLKLDDRSTAVASPFETPIPSKLVAGEPVRPPRKTTLASISEDAMFGADDAGVTVVQSALTCRSSSPGGAGDARSSRMATGGAQPKPAAVADTDDEF